MLSQKMFRFSKLSVRYKVTDTSKQALKDCDYLLHLLYFFSFHLLVKLFTLPAVFALVNKDFQTNYN